MSPFSRNNPPAANPEQGSFGPRVAKDPRVRNPKYLELYSLPNSCQRADSLASASCNECQSFLNNENTLRLLPESLTSLSIFPPTLITLSARLIDLIP